MNNAVVFNQVNKRYLQPKTLAVADFSLEIRAGEFFCFVGPSGCGKSTVLKMIAGLEEPTAGEIKRPENVAMVFQSGALLPWLTVGDNVAFGLKMAGHPKTEIAQAVTKYLTMVSLKDFAHRYPRELSGGQRQRVGIARALVVEPSVLLLDEPFSALDPLTTAELHKDLLKIWEQTKITVVMVSHLLEEAAILADRVAVMANGQLKGVVEIDIPRPRNPHKEIFFDIVSKLHRLL